MKGSSETNIDICAEFDENTTPKEDCYTDLTDICELYINIPTCPYAYRINYAPPAIGDGTTPSPPSEYECTLKSCWTFGLLNSGGECV